MTAKSVNDELGFSPATDYSLAMLADLFTRSFEGYVMPVNVTAAALARSCRVEDVDLHESRVVLIDGAPVGLGFVTRRGDRSRLGIMGFVPACRGRKVGQRTLAHLLDEARARGDRSMTLECFTNNAAGVALYKRGGFRIMRLLVGWERPAFPEGEGDASELTERAPNALGEARALLDLDLPWQLAAPTLAAWSSPMRTFSIGDEALACFTASESALTFRGLLTSPSHRRRGLARRLLGAISARFPGRALHFPPVFPEEASPEFFRAVGFSQAALAQHEMIWTP
jgi:GNAT superfamily N-acetyltransferase